MIQNSALVSFIALRKQNKQQIRFNELKRQELLLQFTNVDYGGKTLQQIHVQLVNLGIKNRLLKQEINFKQAIVTLSKSANF